MILAFWGGPHDGLEKAQRGGVVDREYHFPRRRLQGLVSRDQRVLPGPEPLWKAVYSYKLVRTDGSYAYYTYMGERGDRLAGSWF